MLNYLSLTFLLKGVDNKIATASDFQQCDIFTSVDSDELSQPPYKLRNYKWL